VAFDTGRPRGCVNGRTRLPACCSCFSRECSPRPGRKATHPETALIGLSRPHRGVRRSNRSRRPRRAVHASRGVRQDVGGGLVAPRALLPALLAVKPDMWASQDATVLRTDAESRPIALGSLCPGRSGCSADRQCQTRTPGSADTVHGRQDVACNLLQIWHFVRVGRTGIRRPVASAIRQSTRP
jgi:hypothetical protein